MKCTFAALLFAMATLLVTGCTGVAPRKPTAITSAVALRAQPGSKKLLFIARLPTLRVERIYYLQPWIPELDSRTLEG